MLNKKVLTLATLAGLALGGLSVASVASAQSYGDQETETTESSGTIETDTSDGVTVEVQDTDDDAETEQDAETDDEVDGERRGRRGHRGNCNLDEAAEAIGIAEADLEAAIEDGSTIAEVAEANGVDPDDVIAAMLEAKQERIAEKVEAGRITQEEADEKLADAEDRISDRVNGVEDAAEA